MNAHGRRAGPKHATALALILGMSGFALAQAQVYVDDRIPRTEEQLVMRGQYLVRASDCAGCHTAEGGEPFAGGRPVPTPFGIIYAPNITPDKQTGIGNWSAEDFYNTLHSGLDDKGNHLYPAMPYPWYTKLTRDDVDSIKAWLDTLPAVNNPHKKSELSWPLSIRGLMGAWNTFYFDAGTFLSDRNKDELWNRGAYLVQGPGHCSACHAKKNFAGASDHGEVMNGGFAEHVYAPSLSNDPVSGIGEWSIEDIELYLATGRNGKASATGPMVEVIENSTQHLSQADLRAIATYLKDQPGDMTHKQNDDRSADKALAANDDQMQRGQGLYIDQCAGCHMSDGRGIPDVFPSLTNNPSVRVEHPETLMDIVLNGARSAATPADQTGLKMPAFGGKLDDAQVADVITYVRNAWGNGAAALDKDDVADLREKTKK